MRTLSLALLLSLAMPPGLGGSLAFAQAAADSQRIARIEVRGNRRVEADAIRAALVSKPGTELDRARAREDIKSLWRLGFFSDVQLSAEQSPEGVVLLVTVAEKPSVRAVKIVGNKELSDEDLKDLVDVKPFSILNVDALRRNAKKVQDKYVEKGYYLAEVHYEARPEPDNEVSIDFVVEEHAKVQVKRITFVGNDHVSDEDLKDSMQTGEGGLLSFLTQAGTYRDEVFQRDLAMIQGVYYDRGFVNVRVSRPVVTLSPDKKFIYISIPISEGEQFSVGKLDFSGDLVLEKPELEGLMVVSAGDMFNRSKLQVDIQKLNDMYHDRGYAYANISPLTRVDADARTIDLTFEIEKGPLVTVERIEVVGNTKTRDKVIRRELRVYEGELYSGTGMRLSRQRVTALGFFESVELSQKKGSTDDRIVVVVEVKERPTGTFQLGFGFSSVENFILSGQISQNNIFGWGQALSGAVQKSSLRTLVQLSYVDPYFQDTNVIFSFDYFLLDTDYFSFLRKSNGGDLTFGYHFTPDLMVTAGYNLEYVEVSPSNTQVLFANEFRKGLISGLKLNSSWDKRDNRLFPTAGHLLSGSIEFNPSWLGSGFRFTRYTAFARKYLPLFAGLVFKVNGQIGYVAGDDVPISERYYVGGINSVRGYRLRTISPTVRIGDSATPDARLTTNAVGGNKQLIFNVELEFPIFEKVGIRGVLFYDAGNSFSRDENFFSSNARKDLPLGLFHSVGFGFRWFSPMGPLRFEWGFPLTPRPEDEKGPLFEFTIGNFF